MLEKVGLGRSSKSTKYELESSYGDPVHERFSVLKTAKLPRECNGEDGPRSSAPSSSSSLPSP